MRQRTTPLVIFNKIANSLKQKSERYVWEWILRVWDDEMNRKLNQTALCVCLHSLKGVKSQYDELYEATGKR